MINIEPVNTYIITYSPEIFDSRFSIKNNSDKWLIKVTRNDANINATSYEIIRRVKEDETLEEILKSKKEKNDENN